MRNTNFTLLATLLLAVSVVNSTFGATTVISDTCTTANTNSGFALGEGVNSGINPPTNTRLTGTAVANLRYYQTVTTRDPSHYAIYNNQIRVTTQTEIGRFTLSANSSIPFDFSPSLGALYATAANPATYDITIGMRNNATSTARMSFAFATAEGDVTTVDFGLQLWRAASATLYTIQKRIDDASSGAGDVNAPITTAGTVSTMVNFLIRVTDAGAESGTDYHSRVQVSMDNGSTWIYDTSTDGDLPNGFRFDGPGRYVVFDQAPNGSGNVLYDTFSITSTYAPAPPPAHVWTGGGANNNWSTPANWGGTAIASGDPLIFNGTLRQSNVNDIPDLAVPSVTLSNGGFTLYGNLFTNTIAITNAAGLNILAADMAWDTTGIKTWTVAGGSELVLSNTTTVEVNGDHSLWGGGTLRQKGAFNVGQATTANPPFIVNEGQHIVDGSSFTSRGGYRIGSLATAATGAQTILTNGATFAITATAGNIRVGDSANPVTSRLLIDHSTLTSAGARLCIPFAAGATSEVVQVGGTVSGARISFSDSGAGKGTYAITNGTLETYNIAEGTSGALSYMYFNNALLRALSGATNAFMSGLNRAEILSGGLTIDAQTEIVIAQKLIGAGCLTNSGYSTVTLAGANSYTGDTVVSAGKLVLTTGHNYVGAVRVADYTELGVAVGTPGTSLTNGSLVLGSSGIATLTFDLGAYANPAAPMLVVTNLSANNVVNINIANGLELSTGQFVLIDYQGSIGGSGLGYDSFVLNNLPSGVSAVLVNNTANSSIDLKITGAPGIVWTGAEGRDWDYSKQSWLDQSTGLATSYSDSLQTFFRDGAATGIVDMLIYPYPSALIVSNDTLPYVWNGGAITTPILKKHGPGSLTRVEGQADLITEIELNNGSYIFSNTYGGTFASLLTDASAGTGTFVKRGAGPLTVSSVNDTFEGTTVIQDGILALGATRSLGSTSATIIITNGGTLELNDHQPVQPVIVSGAGVDGQGAIIDSTTATAVEYNLRDVIMRGDTTFGCASGRWDLRANGGHGPGPGLRGNGFTLTKVGGGHVSIANQRTTTGYWEMDLGDVLIREGTLTFAESLTPGNPAAALAVYPGATFNVYDLGLTNPLLRNITMTNAMIDSGGGSDGTNLLNGNILLSGECKIRADQDHLIINGDISGEGSIGFYASAPGTLLLNGNNSYTGNTTVTNGTFGGAGVLAGNLVMLDGTNAPGYDGVGTFTVNGSVTLAGTTRMELNRNLSPNSDRIVAGGTLSFGGVLQVMLGVGAPAPQAGDVYQLFNKGSGSFFTAVTLPDLTGLPGGLGWDTSKLTVDGTISVTGTIAPPTIGSVSMSGGSFTFSGTGGVEGDPYLVVSSTNVAVALGSWTPVYSNLFGPGGSFSFSTNIVGGSPKAFFRLLVP